MCSYLHVSEPGGQQAMTFYTVQYNPLRYIVLIIRKRDAYLYCLLFVAIPAQGAPASASGQYQYFCLQNPWLNHRYRMNVWMISNVCCTHLIWAFSTVFSYSCMYTKHHHVFIVLLMPEVVYCILSIMWNICIINVYVYIVNYWWPVGGVKLTEKLCLCVCWHMFVLVLYCGLIFSHYFVSCVFVPFPSHFWKSSHLTITSPFKKILGNIVFSTILKFHSSQYITKYKRYLYFTTAVHISFTNSNNTNFNVFTSFTTSQHLGPSCMFLSHPQIAIFAQ